MSIPARAGWSGLVCLLIRPYEVGARVGVGLLVDKGGGDEMQSEVPWSAALGMGMSICAEHEGRLCYPVEVLY